jgi:murein DD-endopeptidase MepM/ murein hydrolase activator NlpD
MHEDHFLDDFPAVESTPSPKKISPDYPEGIDLDSQEEEVEAGSEGEAQKKNRFLDIWEGISRLGLAEVAIRLGTQALLVAVILIVAWGMRELYNHAAQPILPPQDAFAASLPTPTPTEPAPNLPPLQPGAEPGVLRLARLHTDVPSRPRTEVITYTVQTGDTLFGIAEKFGLKPETILWANQYTLGDNPHSIRPNQILNILPVNGTYHRWSEGDGLNGVAKFFGVTPQDIIGFPGNHLDPATIGDLAHPNIQPGTMLIIPGGKRAFVSWSAPVIPLNNPGVAKVLGPGACGAVSPGAVGSGAFIWPSDHHFLSGFDYTPDANHPAIDIDGDLGNPVYAADSGTVVYAGWNNWGYGNVIVINHGNGWQTLYAHLSALNVGCGASVGQGAVIGAIGSTGNSTGPHLHFEMMYNGVKVNPHDYLP